MKRATSPMKRAKHSFLNLFKLMSSSKAAMGDSSSLGDIVGDSGHLLRTYRLNERFCLTVAQGSVVDFASKTGAIVNAANEGCLGGGGVDGAISSAGGDALYDDRLALPKIRGMMRCPTGDAKITGPNQYGSLRVPYVIHAVGPNYSMFDEEEDVKTPHRLLHSAYYRSMDCAIGTPIEKIGFSLLSAGIFRGSQSLGRVLAIGVNAIREWANQESNLSQSAVTDVVFFAYTNRQVKTLLLVCDTLLRDNLHIDPPPPPPPPHMEEGEDEDAQKKNSLSEEEKAEAEYVVVEKDASKLEETKLVASEGQADDGEGAKKDDDQEMADKENIESPSTDVVQDKKEEIVEDKKEDQVMTNTEENSNEKVNEIKKKEDEVLTSEAKESETSAENKKEDQVMMDTEEKEAAVKDSGMAEDDKQQDEAMAATEGKETSSKEEL